MQQHCSYRLYTNSFVRVLTQKSTISLFASVISDKQEVTFTHSYSHTNTQIISLSLTHSLSIHIYLFLILFSDLYYDLWNVSANIKTLNFATFLHFLSACVCVCNFTCDPMRNSFKAIRYSSSRYRNIRDCIYFIYVCTISFYLLSNFMHFKIQIVQIDSRCQSIGSK